MSIVLLGVLTVGFGFSAQFSGISDATTEDSLQKQFRDPPREYSLMPLWAWNSTLTREKLTWQIDQMMEKGVYGAFMHARAGLDESQTPYFSEGFWDAVKISVEHAEKTGFQAWIYDEDKWPSGSAGGRTMRANPERFTATGLQHEGPVVEGPSRKSLSFVGAKFVSAARLVGENRIDPATMIDLNGLQEWNVPPGRWHVCILRAGHGGHSLPNYINPDAVREFLNNTHEQYAARFGRHFGKTIPGVFFDEIGNLPLAWDPLLAERFRRAKGYELEKMLPLLWHDGDARTIKVRCDYFDVLTKLYEEAWFKQISEWCERHNLKLTGHTLETLRHVRDQGDYFRTWRHPQIPGTDNEDFRYTFPRTIGAWKPKQIASVSHLYGTQRVAAEALGGAGWPITLEQTRYGVNMLAVYGINFFIFHLFHYEMDTAQSMDDWPNSWFYQNPYWKYFRKLADYTRRVSLMGSQGSHVTDVALLYPVEELWSRKIPENLFEEEHSIVLGLVERLMREQMDCDLVDTDSIIAAASVGQGRARIGRESYRVLVLPDTRTVSLAAYRRVAEMTRRGLRVVAVGAVPRHSAENGADDPEVIRISRELFGGHVLKDEEALVALLRKSLQPDVEVIAGRREALRVLHRKTADRDIYFLVNAENQPAEWTLRFAATGVPQRWNPENGEVAALTPGELSSGSGALRLKFRPWEAFYLVFGGTAVAAPAPQPQRSPLPDIALAGSWTFQAAPTELDDVWKPDPGETRVELPVLEMRIGGAQTGGQQPWRRLKIADEGNPKKGAARYLSAWDASWITRYVYSARVGEVGGELGGDEVDFRKTVEVPFPPARAWLTIVADKGFECSVNGVAIASGKAGAGPVAGPINVERLPLKQGTNIIEVTVRNGGYLLVQGEITSADGGTIAIRSDRGWQTRLPGREWISAYEFTYPPFGVWGDQPLRGKRKTLPATVWYRASLPPGARSMERPGIGGRYEFFVDDKPVAMPATGDIPLPAGAVISLEVEATREDDGLRTPLAFHCRPIHAPLGDWRKLGLDWYSGRGVYRTEFELPRNYAGRKVMVNLGELRYTGEVWVNGKLAGTMAWAPYEADISRLAVAGRNELVVVAANLLANRMRWDIFDSAIPSRFSRWWHDGSILRESDHLTSGLLGPVRIRVEE